MKVKELIKLLQKFNGDTEVTVWADHGQTDFKCSQAEEAFISKDEWDSYMMEGTHPDDVEDLEDYVRVCQIS